MIIKIFGFWCPLTAVETWLEVRGGVSAYRGPFLLHYLDAVVYPNIPPNLLIASAVAIYAFGIYGFTPGVSVSDIHSDEQEAAGRVVDGRLFRRVCRTGTIWGEEMTEKVVWHVVKQYAGILGVSKLSPHDLRRSCARL